MPSRTEDLRPKGSCRKADKTAQQDFVNCTLHQLLLERSTVGGWDGRDMKHEWVRERDSYTVLILLGNPEGKRLVVRATASSRMLTLFSSQMLQEFKGQESLVQGILLADRVVRKARKRIQVGTSVRKHFLFCGMKQKPSSIVVLM